VKAILPRSPELCQNGGLSILSSIGETDTSMAVAYGSHVVVAKNCLVKTEV
jgi:hypothetical protein